MPGIMATRTISDHKDRLTTILIAPLMTCSARLPVYTLIIAAFIPNRTVGWGIGLQGLVLFVLYVTGIVGALVAALVLRRSVTKGKSSGFLMEMPKYQWPRPRDILLGLWQRAAIFLKRAGTIIFISTIVLWALLSFPKPPEGSNVSPVDYSIAGRIAGGLNTVLEPIGFNRDISLALVPAMAAREVAVSALATVYSIEQSDDEAKTEQSLSQRLQGRWSLPTALAFLAWFVFAPQCISTIAVARRETNGWRWPMFMVAYLFALAYIFAGITFWTATALGLYRALSYERRSPPPNLRDDRTQYGRRRQQGDSDRESWRGAGSSQLPEWRQGLQYPHRDQRKLEGSEYGRAQGPDRMAHCRYFLGRPGQCR